MVAEKRKDQIWTPKVCAEWEKVRWSILDYCKKKGIDTKKILIRSVEG